MLMRLQSRLGFTPLLDVSLQSTSLVAAPDGHVLHQVCMDENWKTKAISNHSPLKKNLLINETLNVT